MDGEETIYETAAVESFAFAGIGNFFISGDQQLHFTFWDWQREPGGLIIRAAVRHGRCAPSIVPGCAQQALAAISTCAFDRALQPFRKLLAS